jgi:MFS family permease
MFIRKPLEIIKDQVWSKVLTLGLILFFIFLGDAVLSFWAPNLIQDSLKNSAVMGLVISFSSVVGLGMDLILPQILKGVTVRRLVLGAIILGLGFTAFLVGGVYKPLILIFLGGMAVWGVYYELLGFASQQFVADTVPLRQRAGAWGILRIFRDLAYFLGPLLAGWVVLKGEIMPAVIASFFVVIAFVILLLSQKKHDRVVDINIKEVNLIREIEHWAVLFKYVWPVVLLSLVLGLIDSVFWTTGAVWTEHLAKTSFWGGMFLPFYTLPALFTGFIVARLGIYQGKKRLAMKFLLLAGIFLAALGISEAIPWQLAMVFVSSLLLAIVYPLIDGVYTDITARMGRERKHMIGLSNSTASLAYIIGPALAGITASLVGERTTFVITGVITVLVSIILLLTTPRKLRLPQTEIKNWEN